MSDDGHQMMAKAHKSAHFVMIHYQTLPPQAILASDWPLADF
jgi:hypothetical protein